MIDEKSHRYPFAAACSVAVVILLVVYAFDRAERRRRRDDLRLQALRELSTVRARLEGSLNALLFLSRGLEMYVQAKPRISEAEFCVLGHELMERNAGLRSVQLARNTVISHVYPPAGNEAVIGLDLLREVPTEQQAALRRALHTRSIVVAGPVRLLQGGVGLIIRTPIYTRRPTRHYWGLATLVIDVESVYRDAGLERIAEAQGLEFAIRGRDARGADGEVFYGRAALFDAAPATMDVWLPNGSWQLAGVPRGGWAAVGTAPWLWPVGGALAVTTALLVWRLLLYPQRLRRAVAEATEALASSELERRGLLDNLTVGVLRHAPGLPGHIIQANPATARILGFSSVDAMLNIGTTALYEKAADRDRLQRMLDDIGQVRSEEVRLRRRDGHVFWAAYSAARIADADGRTKWIDAVIEDISDRRHAEEALKRHERQLEDQVTRRTAELSRRNAELRAEMEEREKADQALAASERKFRALFEFAPVAIFLEDIDGRILDCNLAAATMTGYTVEKLVQMHARDVTPPEVAAQFPALAEELQRTGSYSGDFDNVHRDGHRFPVRTNIKLVRHDEEDLVLVMAHDQTEFKRLEAEVFNAQKLESLGVLAGGIAHDFNNILTAVTGNLSLVRRYLRTTNVARAHEKLDATEAACVRAQDLTHQLLTFAKGGAPMKRVVSVWDLVRESAGFVLHGSKVKLEMDVTERLWAVEADAGQISQVINNLVINACEAMPDGGVIRLIGRNVDVGPDSDLSLAPGRYVRLSVADDGPGIAPADRERVFDPYFTTKPDGTGLGLAAVYSIVRRHDGAVHVASVPTGGTVFHVCLPATMKTVVESAPATADGEDIVVGHGRVLIMDDDALIRAVAEEALDSLGYEVEATADGAEAVERYRTAFADGRRFDLVIMDLTIPGGIGGREALQQLREIDPDVRAIVSSGYSEDPVLAKYCDYGFAGVVAKPYDLATLSRVVATVLDA